jgi:arylsulfatase A-like enzyme
VSKDRRFESTSVGRSFSPPGGSSTGGVWKDAVFLESSFCIGWRQRVLVADCEAVLADDMKNFLLLLVSLGFLIFGSISATAERPPNIVFIMADDLGWNELGCYGQSKIKTPRIDQLAREGMRFTNAYSGNAVCAPSRCVLMTGKHPGTAAVRNNRSMLSQGEPEGQHPIPASEVTIAEALAPAGYVSGAFGKWGLGNTTSTGSPDKQGFTRFFGYNCQGVAHSYWPETLWSDLKKVKLNNQPPVPGHANLPKGSDPKDPASYEVFKGQDYAPDRINAQALEFVRKHQDKPFFLYYPTIIPHVALHVPDEEMEPYLALGWNDPPFTKEGQPGYTPHFTPRAAYAAMITRMDTYMGRVFDLLDELELRSNTIVVFTSDNGATYLPEVDYEFFDSVGALRGMKGSLYEGGIRVPLIVRWPGKVAAGTTSDFRTGLEDWLPTLVDLVDADLDVPKGVNGVSLAATLLGKAQPEREFLYREFPAYGGQQAVWMGKWKGIRQDMLSKKNPNPLKTELYDLSADISESTDVATEFPDVVKKIEVFMSREHVPSSDFKFPAID